MSTDAHKLEAFLASILPKQRFSIPEREHIHTDGGREIDIEKFKGLRQVAIAASEEADGVAMGCCCEMFREYQSLIWKLFLNNMADMGSISSPFLHPPANKVSLIIFMA